MKLAHVFFALITMTAMCSLARAQWQKIPDKGLPRTKDGKPNLLAPAPRKADGKPDLSGVWVAAPPKMSNVANALKEGSEISMQPRALALFNERRDGARSAEEPDGNCLSQGVPKINMTPFPFKIVQNPDLVAILYEAFDQFRQIFMDGREPVADLNPTWLGYSTGKWDGDTLVVESTGFNGRIWLDGAGHPTTEAMRVTERFRRRDFGHLELQATIDDPKAYTKPWTIVQPLLLLPEDELIENVCNENEKDVSHMKAAEASH